MIKSNLTISNKLGLHARASAKLTKLAGIMQGAQIPTSVKTTMCMSPFSALGGLVILLKVWKPKDTFHMEGDGPIAARPKVSASETLLAWSPFILLVTCVLVWGAIKPTLMKQSILIEWPGLHNLVQTMPPVSARCDTVWRSSL